MEWNTGFRGLLLGALCVILGLSTPPAVAVTFDDILLYSRARTLAVQGDYSAAITIYEDEIANNPNRPLDELSALIRDLAQLYILAGRHEEGGEAYLILSDAVARLEGRTSPTLSDVYASAGHAFDRSGQSAKAIDNYERALEIDRRYLPCDNPGLGEILTRLVRLYQDNDQLEIADELRPLAIDVDSRCNHEDYRPKTRQIVVEDQPPPATEDSFTKLDVYYATDRARTGSPKPNTFYGGERATLEMGVLEVTVPRSHKPGVVEAPSIILLEWSDNPDRHIVISRIEPLTEQDALMRMRMALKSRGADEAFVFVHGYNTSFASAAKRTAQIAYDLNFEGIPFVYSWPSLGNPFGYTADEAVVRLGGRRLMKLLEKLSSEAGIRRIHLIAHSMGNRALADALELLAMRQSGLPPGPPLFDQVLFAAPDIDRDLFADMSERFHSMARRMTLYASQRDSALETSRSIHGEQSRAGEAGDHVFVSKSVDTIDMSELGDGMLGHSYFADDTSALSDILWLFWRDDSPSKRCGMAQTNNNLGVFWRYDVLRCDGDVALSALTLLREHGEDAHAHALSRLASQSDGASALRSEWQAIAELIASALNR